MSQNKLVIAWVIGEVGAVDPGFGNIAGGPRPDQGLPGYGHPDQGLPGRQPRPDQGLPWTPGHPDNSLPLPPGINPPNAPPAMKDKLVVLWRLPNTTEWHGKAMEPGARPDAGLPGSQPGIDNTLPGSQPHPDAGLPPTATPKA